MNADSHHMRLALEEARKAAQAGEAPIAAGNAPIATHYPTGHAEIWVLREAAAKLGNYRLPDTTLYVTLEPCAMCAGAISIARVRRLVIAARDPKGGAVWHGPKYFDQPTCHWRPEVIEGPFADEAGALLRDFFRARR